MTCCSIPKQITAGLTFEARLKKSGFPPAQWSAKLMLRGPSVVDIQATVDGDYFVFTAPATETANWLPGNYWYAVRATSGTDVQELESSQTTVLPDMANAPEGYDGRTPAEIALEAIEAVLAKRATMDQERYRINNRELYRTPIADLIKLRDMYRAEVNRERAAKCGKNPFGRKVRVVLR